MKKEILIAIFIGVCFGLLIIFGIWTANKSINSSPDNTLSSQQTAPQVEPTAPPEEELKLEITFPKNNYVSDKETLEISGKSSPNAIIAIIYPEGEAILEADDNGSFSTEISLAGANNEIKISAYDLKGNEKTEIINVVYSTAQI